MSDKFPSGLYKCATCQEVCAEPEALQAAKVNREELQYTLDEVVELLEGYVDVKDGADGQPVPNKAMRAVQLLQDVMKVQRKSGHRFSNRKEVRQQFVPGLKIGGGQ